MSEDCFRKSGLLLGNVPQLLNTIGAPLEHVLVFSECEVCV
uniref:TTL/TEL fusion protein TTL-B1 n=1 Tax=Homo sapiens TaxID=9606 RepID=Q8NEU2_HUMAN|nr:TTL/TEL fusion protein TTL-B1 [Homo sapiens]